MSDDISISEGGYTAVSSESLRDAASRAIAVADLLRETVTSATRASDNLDCMTIPIPSADTTKQVAVKSAVIAQMIEVFATRLARAADVYEAVELLITTEMHGSTPATEQRLADLEADNPGLLDEAMGIVTIIGLQKAPNPRGGFQFFSRLGALPRTGIDVRMVERSESSTTNVKSIVPHGAADLAKAIPSDGTQIRVDRYDMPDGSQRFVVSIVGTQQFFSETGPFDMSSNAALYLGNDSASAEAVRVALEDAGVQPGDWVLLNAHSQAAMISDQLAPDPTVDPEYVVTWGDPMEMPFPDDVVNIDIKHTNDPVGMLGGSEYPVPTGHPDSFEVSRSSEAGVFGAHFMNAYIETGTLIDQSQDPRLDALREPLAELADAERVTTTEYTFEESPLEMHLAPGLDEPLRGYDADKTTGPAAARGMGGDGVPGAQSVSESFLEFSDPIAPDQFSVAPPPEPGGPIFEFGEQPSPNPEPQPPVLVDNVNPPPIKDDENHVGPWLV